MGPEVLIAFIVFMTPVLLVFLHRYFRLREKQLESQQGAPRMLAAPSPEQDKRIAELQARIENLESILIDLDSSPRAALGARSARAALPTGQPATAPRAQLPAPDKTDED